MTLERKWPLDHYTIGRLMIDGKQICNTLEPPVGTATEAVTRGSGKAISPGTYHVVMYPSARFKCELPLLLDVPGRQGILIHMGNNVNDTKGCILVGMNTIKGHVMQSKSTLATILCAIRNALKRQEPVVITIR